MLGVSVPTIRRWQRSGKLHESHRTLGNHRRFSIESLRIFLGVSTDRKVIGYARVSSHDQKNDLITQAEFLMQHGCDDVITDLGSGMNCRKRGLIKLLKLIVSGQVERLVLTHHDRLLRFGHELVFNLCQWFNVDVLSKASNGAYSFVYSDTWLTQRGRRPIFLSLPLRSERFEGDEVFNFFDNLLPDNPAVRDRIVARHQASTTQPFDLLVKVGRDAVDAITLLPEDELIPELTYLHSLWLC